MLPFYLDPNPETKAEMVEAIAAGQTISAFQPEADGRMTLQEGVITVVSRGPEETRWNAKVVVKDSKITEVL